MYLKPFIAASMVLFSFSALAQAPATPPQAGAEAVIKADREKIKANRELMKADRKVMKADRQKLKADKKIMREEKKAAGATKAGIAQSNK